MGFTAPTPVQQASLPHALEGKDILGSAQTGTGKTGAFGVPLLAKLIQNPGTKALILAPTRELAAQIHKVLCQMSQGTKLKGALVVGGESFWRQMSDIKGGADFLVCTPGRLIDHLAAGLKLQTMSMLVLDEVDRMLDMGFAPQLRDIALHLPKTRQTLFFSATLPKEILSIASQYLKDPVKVSIGSISQPTDRVEQLNIETTDVGKKDLLLADLAKFSGRVLVFARTKQRVDRITEILEQSGVSAVRLHGGLLQGQRKMALDRFRNGSHRVMVATDIAGRGIDVDDIECVINVDPPENREDYIHRIGRTARNGKSGRALNYLTKQDHRGRRVVGTSTVKKIVVPVAAPVVTVSVPSSVPTPVTVAMPIAIPMPMAELKGIASESLVTPLAVKEVSTQEVSVQVKPTPTIRRTALPAPRTSTPIPTSMPKPVVAKKTVSVAPAQDCPWNHPTKKPLTVRRPGGGTSSPKKTILSQPLDRKSPQYWEPRDQRSRRIDLASEPEKTHTVYHAPPATSPLVKRPGKRGPLPPFGERKRLAAEKRS